MQSPTKLLFESALLPTGWASNVAVEIDQLGNFKSLETHSNLDDNAFKQIAGCVVPGMPNCHSHAHQRAMAGLGEKADWDDARGKKTTDSFWTWRVAMYHYLERIQPHHLYAIARHLYLEMLKMGYTNVGEFQYLHHDQNGKAYKNRAEMTLQCMQAAMDLGMGFTALPVLYGYGGFGGQEAIAGQKRFINSADQFCEIVEALFDFIEQSKDKNSSVGIAPHSIRAITEESLSRVIANLSDCELAAVHVHVAEQTKEVEDCRAWCGERPVEWLLNRFDLNPKWCLIHATHMDDVETARFAQSGAVAGLCPTTEGNLGDGFFNLIEFEQHGGMWAIGSDSHISISPVEELRWLEYGQRLLTRQRNVMASPSNLNTGRALFSAALQGGRQSSGRKIGSLKAGSRADFVVLDNQHPRLYGRSEDSLIDSWIFSGNHNPVQQVFVGGKQVIDQGCHVDEENISHEYKRTMDELAEL